MGFLFTAHLNGNDGINVICWYSTYDTLLFLNLARRVGRAGQELIFVLCVLKSAYNEQCTVQ